uniref:RagB/SusD family nutrient uptake outer membrane protein n=1 Tax=uncultured Prevotella sp. TaxID=159272 RepID=A0A6G8F121_9BACT|nr:hypothetical protein Prevot485_0660 [uncultured Prevotella sp.]
MKKIFLSIIASACILGFTSCSDMLETESSRQAYDPALDEKTDSVFFAYGVMQAMQQLADQYFFQNEMRGELVQPTSKASVHLQQLANFTAGTDCKYDSVYLYYKVINNCNYYLANRDTTLTTSKKNVVINEYVAIASFRAWAYLQLTHQYGNVPYVTEPVLSISQINSVTEMTDYKEILRSQAEYLQNLKNRFTEEQIATPVYRTDFSIGSTQWKANKRIYPDRLFIPLNVILGDIYLEMGEYPKAAKAYFDYLRYTGINGYIGNFYAERRNPKDDYGITFPAEYLSNERQNNALFPSLSDDDADGMRWNFVFGNKTEQITYIPMATNYTNGKVTELPLAFGYDYYSSQANNVAKYRHSYGNNRYCPETEEMQVVPSDIYMDMANHAPYYYVYTSALSAQTVVSQANIGDARANDVVRSNDENSNCVFVQKPSTGEVYLYRNTTVYLRLAEALNRMGYPELAFAVLKTGIHTGIRSYLTSRYDPTSGENPDNYYIPDEAYQLLVDEIPFFSEANEPIFTNTTLPNSYIAGVHMRGAGAVDFRNSTYRYRPVVEERIEKIRNDFNLGLSGQPYTKEEYINAMEDLLCDEYAMEFAFEGTRFSDLLRIARHKNMASPYTAAFGDTWLSKKLESKAPGITTQNCYLPFK